MRIVRHVELEVDEIEDFHRRIRWRCRELGTSITRVAKNAGLSGSLFRHLMRRDKITADQFDRLTELLRMDEVDGWHRPFPRVPPATATLAEAFDPRKY